MYHRLWNLAYSLVVVSEVLSKEVLDGLRLEKLKNELKVDITYLLTYLLTHSMVQSP